MVGESHAAGFAGAAGGVWAGNNAAIHAEAAGDFFGEVPGGGATCEHDFVEDVERVVFFDRADARHRVHVEVHPQQKGQDWDVGGLGVDVAVSEGDRHQAGKILEAGFKFLAEGAGVELASGGFDFFRWDVVAFDCRELPAAPVVVAALGVLP